MWFELWIYWRQLWWINSQGICKKWFGKFSLGYEGVCRGISPYSFLLFHWPFHSLSSSTVTIKITLSLMPNSLRVFWGYGCLIQKLLLLLVAWSCPTLCDPMDCSMPGFPVLHRLPELAQTYVHWVSETIQPSCPLLSPSPAFNLSQHQGLFPMRRLFASGGQSIGASASTSVLPMNIQSWKVISLWIMGATWIWWWFPTRHSKIASSNLKTSKSHGG